MLGEKFKLPDFYGYDITTENGIRRVNFLEGDFGEAVLYEYWQRASTKYSNSETLNRLQSCEGVIVGSNPLSAILINEILRPYNLRTATPADLEVILEQKALDLTSSYFDTALVLRTQCDPNGYLSQYLVRQIKARDGKMVYPVMIPLAGLEFDDPNSEESRNSPIGVAFKLREDAEVIYAPQLSHDHQGEKFSRTDSKGLPIFSSDGTRVLHTLQFGLVRLYFGDGSNIKSDCEGLVVSNEAGRVVVVSGETAAQKG